MRTARSIGMMMAGWLLFASVQAQSPEKRRAMELFHALTERYRSFKGLSYSVHYRYASEARPSIYLDSLKGEVKMSGDRYLYRLDSTEFIGNKELTIVLYRQDQLMYLIRSGSAGTGRNPLALMDSLLLKKDSIQCQVEESDKWQTIRILFPSGKGTKRMEYVVDRKSGLMTKMISVVLARELYDPSVQSLVEGGESYAIVEADLTDYKEQEAAIEELDLNRYFRKEGKEFIPLSPYQSYKIVLGNPDLQ